MEKINKFWKIDNFLEVEDFIEVVNNLPTEYKSHRTEGVKRLFAIAPPIVDRTIRKYSSKLRTILDEPQHSIKDLVEVRKYKIGDGMDWHRDYLNDKTYSELLYECILTLNNSSDSETEFEGGESVKTVPNQLLIVCRNGINHRVTTLTKGERAIIKFRFCNRGY